MPTTANRGYPTPTTTTIATIPAHMQDLADAIDGDVQQIADRLEAREQVFVAHAGNGEWAVVTGLGEPILVSSMGDGDWQIFP